jgi:hypothetical protein
MRRRSIAVVEVLYEQYILSRMPNEEQVALRLLVVLPFASAAIFTATVAYMLAN